MHDRAVAQVSMHALVLICDARSKWVDNEH